MSAAPPKMTTKEWATRWQGGCKNIDDLVEGVQGEQKFPSADTRQHQLIALVINTALLTALYESIKWNYSATQLEKLLHLSGRSDTPKTIEQVMESIHAIRTQQLPREQEQQAFMKLVMDLSEEGYVKTHRTLITDATWNRFITEHNHTRQVWDEYHENFKHWNEERLGPPPPYPPENPNPDDPRRIACNELVKQWIEIPNSNIKTRESIERKLRDRGGDHMPIAHIGREVRDVNRLTITPNVPETADDFFSFLHFLHPTKGMENDVISRVQVEGWTVKNSCQFDRMAYVALDKREDKLPSNGAVGMVAEIKTIGAKMANADRMTAPLYDALKDLRNVRPFFVDGQSKTKKEGAQGAQNRFRDVLQRSATRFASICRELKSPYQFPPMPKEGTWNRDDTYANLGKALIDLSRTINIDALNREAGRKEWAEKFLDCAFTQQERARLTAKGMPSSAQEATLETPIIKRIGVGEGMDEHWRKAIHSRAKKQVRVEAAGQHSGSKTK